jgi:hypothetical protein
MMLGRSFLVMEARFFFLQVAGVGQHHRAQVDGGLGGVNGAVKAFFHQPRNPAAVVEMSVGEDDGVNGMRRHRCILPIARAPFLGPLEEPAVDQHLHAFASVRIVAGIDEVFRPGDSAGSAKKLKIGHELPFGVSLQEQIISQEDGV